MATEMDTNTWYEKVCGMPTYKHTTEIPVDYKNRLSSRDVLRQINTNHLDNKSKLYSIYFVLFTQAVLDNEDLSNKLNNLDSLLYYLMNKYNIFDNTVHTSFIVNSIDYTELELDNVKSLYEETKDWISQYKNKLYWQEAIQDIFIEEEYKYSLMEAKFISEILKDKFRQSKVKKTLIRYNHDVTNDYIIHYLSKTNKIKTSDNFIWNDDMYHYCMHNLYWLVLYRFCLSHLDEYIVNTDDNTKYHLIIYNDWIKNKELFKSNIHTTLNKLKANGMYLVWKALNPEDKEDLDIINEFVKLNKVQEILKIDNEYLIIFSNKNNTSIKQKLIEFENNSDMTIDLALNIYWR